ncbi:uncharacterized protein LOC108739956 isoform X2 [Agrilus planipennis]|uniref:Uncharacterized protein LOC108739956 isoform X2 n=1 Tax=Agrilus planipennis TaxID=224129 RepID=A0A1W4X0C7_AGRPL|nr:uncharacterized protein LOC108739956 isoform X2 [Agrilus planipennis]
MAFRKGANKLGHKANNINNEIDKSIVNAYKKSEEILNSGSPFTEKIPCLIEVWKQARLYSVEPQKNYVIHLMDWLKRHTLNIILTGDWKKYKDIYEDVLINEVAHCELAFKRYNPNFSLRCKKLAEIIRDPWGNNVLHRLLNRSDIVITQEELEFFAIETGYIISMRLKMLCESHCEDLALNLATTCLQCYKVAEEQNFNINATEDQKRFILDTYIALLFKFKKTSTIIVILKTLPLQQGLDLVKRFSNKRISISKIWRYSKKITHLAAQVYITAAVLKPPEDSLEILKQLLTVWLSLDVNSEESLTQAIRRILQAADSAVHMYIFCELIHNKITMKPFTIELFIRALTTDMNDLERQKNEENSLKVTEITNRLATGFLRLADVLDDHLKVSRECVLTAFSLQPNELTIQRVIMLAKRSGYEVLDTGQKWKCKLHPPAKDTDEVLWQCGECGEYMSKIEFPSALNTDTALCEALVSEELGLSSQLCDDLAVVIAGPRYQFLSWRLEWADLNNLCILYLNDPDRTKNLVKELKFVQIDYSMFTHIKKEPEDDELAGIERGYEMYLQDEEDDEIGSSEDSASLDSRCNGLGSDGTGESPIRLLPFLPSTSKQSDPNVLKSLRMFRPTLKRTKENCSTSDISSNKVFMGSENNSNTLPSRVHTISSNLFNNTNSFECLSNAFFKERNYTDSISALNQNNFSPSTSQYTIPYNNVSEGNAMTMDSGNVNSLNDHGISLNKMKKDEDTRSTNEQFTDNYKIHLLSSRTIGDKIHENIRLTSSVVESSRKRSRSCSEVYEPNSPANTDVHFSDKIPKNFYSDDSFQSKEIGSKITSELQQNTSKLNGNALSTSVLEHNAIDKGKLQTLSDSCTLKSVQNFETFCSTHCKYIKIDKQSDEVDNVNNANCLLVKFPLKEVKVVLDRILVPNSKLNSIELTSSSSTYTRRKMIKLQGNFKNSCVKQFSGKEEKDPRSCLLNVDSTACLNGNTVKIPNPMRNNLNPLVLLQRIQSIDNTVNKMTDESNTANKRSDSKFHSETIKNPNIQEVNLKKSWKNPNFEELTKNENNAERKENIEDVENITHNISEVKNIHRKDALITDKIKKVITENQKPKTFGNLYENTNKSSKVSGNSLEKLSVRREDRKLNDFKLANSVDQNKNKMIAADVHITSKNEKPISQSTVRWLVNPKTTQNSNHVDNTYKKYIKKEHRGREKFKNQSEHDDSPINTRYTNLLKHLKEQVAVLSDRSSNKENEKCTNVKMVENDCNEIKLAVKTDFIEESSLFNSENRNRMRRNRSKSFCHEKLFPRIKLKRPNSVCGEESFYCGKTILKPQITISSNKINSNVSNTEDSIKKEQTSTEIFEHTIQKESANLILVNPSENNIDYHSFNNPTPFSTSNFECDQQDCNRRRSHSTVGNDLFTDFEYSDLKMEDLIKFNTKQLKIESCETVINSIALNEADKDILNEFKENNMTKKDSYTLNKITSECKKEFSLHRDVDNGVVLTHKRKNCDNEDEKEKGGNRKKIAKQNSSEELSNVNSVLSGVPGLNDLEMIQPQYTNSLIQVVQVSDPSISTAPTQNSLTSTQITPHIQRVGQPRADKPDNNNSNAPVNSSSVITSLTTSAPIKSSVSEANPTIINILQNQVRSSNANQTIRPIQMGPVLRPAGIITTHSIQRNRTAPPVINILPQQIIRPATIVSCSSRAASATSNNETQINEVHQVVSSRHEDVSQLVTAGRLTSATALKTVVGASAEQSRIVQFICKSSDGKIIPVTSLTPNKIVKVAVTQPVSSSTPNDANISSPSLDSTFTKLIQPIKTNSITTESSEALPKFQQAFGKSYQGNLEAVQILTTPDNENNNNGNSVSNEIKIEKRTLLETDKVVNSALNKSHAKTTLLPNLQHIQGSVIYSHQGVGQTINLIPPGKGQVIRIAASNSDQVSLVKDSIIHNKMSALLAAALQGRQQQQPQQLQPNTSNSTEADSSSEDSLPQSPITTTIKVTPQRQTLVSNARIVKPLVHVSSNVIRSTSNSQSNLSSTTLEQLREFDMVYKQVKERSNTTCVPEVSVQNESIESSPPQISVTYLNQNQKLSCAPVVVVSNYCTVQSAISPALSVSSQGRASPCVTSSPSANFKGNSKSSRSKSVKAVTTHTSKASPIPKPQQKPQEDEHTAQRIFDILAEYAEQLRNSPDLNNKPAPRRRSNPPTNPSQNTKRKKNSGTKKVGVQGGSSNSIITSDTEVDDSRTVGSEDSSCGVVQVALQDEDPSLANPISSENLEPSSSTNPKQQLILTEANSHTRNLILTDSSVGEAFKMSNTAVLMPGNYIMPVSMVKSGQQIRVVSGSSKILAAVPNRSGSNMLLFQSFLNQSRKTNISSVKYSAVQPVSTGIPSQAQSSIILPPTTPNLASFTIGQSVTVKKANESERLDVNNFNGEVFLAISNPRDNNALNASENPVSSDKISSFASVVNNCREIKEEKNCEISQITSLTTCTTSKADSNCGNTTTTQSDVKRNDDEKGNKRKERVQSVLVAPGCVTSPMLCQNTPNYTKRTRAPNMAVSSTKEDFVSSERKVKEVLKQVGIQSYQNKNKKSQGGVQHLDRELHQLSLQRKQAALERELRLQKSLSEECEDLGVDEPSTSELFPEADIYFDSNNSPSFDQSSQEIKKTNQSLSQHTQITTKSETKPNISLFEDDDNSDSFRSDFLFDDPVGYRNTEMELEYDRRHGLTNGQNNICGSKKEETINEDSTLLQNCGSITDVTILPPVIPESCDDPHAAIPMNKCKYKYSNRRKGGDRANSGVSVENWSVETSNAENKVDLNKTNTYRQSPGAHQTDEEQNDGGLKLVKIERGELVKDQADYVEVCSEEDEEVGGCGGSVSGRGARRSVKKLCSCCNGPQDGGNTILRKRPASRPHTPALNKKSLVNKKR